MPPQGFRAFAAVFISLYDLKSVFLPQNPNVMKSNIKFIFFLATMSLSMVAFGQESVESTLVDQSSDSLGQIYIDMPLVTLPAQIQAYNTTGGFFPSYMNPGMENSLAYTTDFYTAAHYGLKKAFNFKSPFWTSFSQRMAVALFDVFTMQLPLAYSWLHEEYHRGVMTQYGVNSFNEVLLFRLGSSSIAVSHETDEEMAMLCDSYHPDFVRLMGAGHEAQVDLNRNLQSNQFFYHQDLFNSVIYWMTAVQNFMYIATCVNGDGDEMMHERNAVEFNIEDRDFTGMDMNAWVDALWYPEKPYADRGTHPSGNGINRYIMTEDLPEECVQYLRKQAGLDLFNFLSPMLIGFHRFRLANTESGPYYGNFAFRHYLTSFGDDISLDLYLQAPWANLYTTLHSYNNFDHHFGGLEVGLVDFPLFDNRLLVGGTLMGWIQPKDMLFKTPTGSFGGLAKTRMSYHSRFVDPYLELGWKSNGWVAGNANLGSGFFLRAGLRWQIG